MRVSYDSLLDSMEWEVNLSYEDRLYVADFLEEHDYNVEDTISLLRDKGRKCAIIDGKIIPGEYQEWTIYWYDVWGNDEDGYEVNDIWPRGTITFFAEESIFNKGTEHQFIRYHISDAAIKNELETNRELDIDGDSDIIYVNIASNGKPYCEFRKE